MATSKNDEEYRKKRKAQYVGDMISSVNKGSSSNSNRGSSSPRKVISKKATDYSKQNEYAPRIESNSTGLSGQFPVVASGGGFGGGGGSFGPTPQGSGGFGGGGGSFNNSPLSFKAGPFSFGADYDSPIAKLLQAMGKLRSGNGQSAQRDSSILERMNSGRTGGGGSAQRDSFNTAFGRSGGGGPAQRGSSEQHLVNGMPLEHSERNYRMSPEEEILKQFETLLGQQFDRQPIDTSYIDNALQSKLGAINAAKGEANDFATTSGGNLQNMYDAFQGNVRGRQGDIQASGNAAQSDVSSVFDKTIAEANARKAAGNAEREEMLSRLGIAPAANGPDLANQAIEEGINGTQGSRDDRVAEIIGGTQRGIENNSMFADALGAEGLGRQAELQRQLQGILGDLRNSEVGARSDHANAMMGVQGDQQDRDYRQWMDKMAMGQDNLDRFINMNDQTESRAFDAANQREQNQADIYMQQIKAAEKSAAGPQGYDGLVQSSNPQTSRIFSDIMSQRGADPSNVNDMIMRFDKNPAYWNAVTRDDFLRYVTQYNQLGTQKTFGQ